MMRATLAVLAALLSLSPACVLAQTAESLPTLHIALREDADMLDPTLGRTYVGRIVFAGMCDKLFDISPELKIVPQLATGYEWSDPKTLVIHLRSGVTFQDGEVLDAAAVKYSLERHLTMEGSARRGEIGIIDHVDIVDPMTVRVGLKSPSSPFLAQLTDRAGMIVAPKAAQAAGKNFAQHPVCAGPFSFVERVAQDRIVLQRYAGYWNAASIHVGRVVYQPIPDSSIRLADLQAGSIDLSEQILPSDVETVKRDSRLRIVTSPALGYEGITNHISNGPDATPYERDARVRQAFELAIDPAALAQVVYGGLYKPDSQAVPSDSPFYVPSITPPDRDVVRARALLQQAGVALPVKVELLTPNSPDTRQTAELIQSMTEEAGFQVHIRVMEFASSLDAAHNGDYEAYLLFWSGRIDIDGNTYSFLHSNQFLNDSRYSNPTVDAALDGARLVTDTNARRDQYRTMWEQERKDLAITYLWTPANIVGLSAKIQGFVSVPDGLIRLQGVSVTQ